MSSYSTPSWERSIKRSTNLDNKRLIQMMQLVELAFCNMPDTFGKPPSSDWTPSLDPRQCKKSPPVWCGAKKDGDNCKKSSLLWCVSTIASKRPRPPLTNPQVRESLHMANCFWESAPHHIRRENSQKPPPKTAPHHIRRESVQRHTVRCDSAQRTIARKALSHGTSSR